MQVDPKSGRNDVYVARFSLGMSQERDRWLLLYPDFGIPKGHAQSSASQWKFPLEHALLVASLVTSSGFSQFWFCFRSARA